MRSIAFALVGCVGGVIPFQGGSPQTFRSSVQGVRIDVLVTDGGGPVLSLTAKDFEVLDEGVVQEVNSARSVGHLAVAFTFDTSLGTRRDGFTQLKSAAELAITALAPVDRAALVSFSDRVTLLAPLMNDRAPLHNALRPLEQSASRGLPRSTVWDAVFTASSLVALDDGRPFVMLFSDGMDNASGLSREETERTLAALALTVDFVRAPRTWNDDQFLPGLNLPDQLAERTGGEVVGSGDKDLARKFRDRLNGLRESYVLTYVPKGVSATKGWHRLTVRVPGRRATVRARPGYYPTPDRK